MILITGATGIIGSHILVEALKANAEVRVLMRKNASTQAIHQLLKYHGLPASFEQAIGDVLDPISLNEAMEGCTAVFHCAAMVSFDPSKRDELLLTNIKGTANMVEICRQHGVKLMYMSSTAALGDTLVDGKVSEESIWTSDKGRSVYSLSKRYAELEVWRGIEEGLEATMVNPAIVIGPGKWGESSTSMYLSGASGMMFYPSGTNGFVDARDVARIAWNLHQAEGVSGQHVLVGENLSFQRVFSLAANVAGVNSPRFSVPKMPVAVFSRLLKMLELVGLNPFKLTSENLKSANRKISFSNEKALGLGQHFGSIEEAMRYTHAVYQLKG